MRTLGIVISVGLTLVLSRAFAQHEPDVGDPREPVPFLADPAQRPDTVRILPPAPREGTAAYETDRQIFLATRKLEGTPRWEQAKRDVPLDVPDMLNAYSCAAGVRLTPVKTPLLAGLLTRMSADAERAIEPPKAANRRLRPLEIDPGAVCQPREKLAGSYDYPSGHATRGWSVGLVLAELMPERSTELLTRARTYAESRVVCGAHNVSAIQAGATNAASLVAVLHGSADFRAAMDAARHEMAAVRATGKLVPEASACALEAQAAAMPY